LGTGCYRPVKSWLEPDASYARMPLGLSTCSMWLQKPCRSRAFRPLGGLRGCRNSLGKIPQALGFAVEALRGSPEFGHPHPPWKAGLVGDATAVRHWLRSLQSRRQHISADLRPANQPALLIRGLTDVSAFGAQSDPGLSGAAAASLMGRPSCLARFSVDLSQQPQAKSCGSGPPCD
jgi:hypothetical protein